MAEEELRVVRLRDDFYRDGFFKVVLSLFLIILAIILLLVGSLDLHLTKPSPVKFVVGKEWRVLSTVPVDQPYLNTADLIQWVSTALPAALTYDFLHYTYQLKLSQQYFTINGWKRFSDILNVYANYNTITNTKIFISGTPAGAPFILNQGLLQGKYAWWVQMPIDISSMSYNTSATNLVVFQVLVVRMPTDNNLDGVAIDNILVSKSNGNQANANG